MNKILFFVSINISCLVVSHAQYKMITGKVIIDDKVVGQDVLDGILVQNLQTDAKNITNVDGIFSINVSAGDELLFKHDFYKERSVKISEAMINRGFITIHLNIEVIELGEANVNRLDKNMLNDLGKEKVFQEKINTQMGINTLEYKIKLNLKHEEEKVNRTIHQIGGVNIMGLFSLLSGSYKKINSKSEIEKTKEELIKDLKQFYTEYYFIEELKIPKISIIGFLDYCYTKYDFKKLLKENKYDEILSVIEEQAPIYLSKINTNIIKND
ncbi:hypothetical protein [Chishuiella sp.]|uniref:hypothetical protein n=1 Tax=Chishuiella sp. TaxID=1969467 RepID=UPI0028A91A2E|nr:hypothetical protein [Chishuiella sp.]